MTAIALMVLAAAACGQLYLNWRIWRATRPVSDPERENMRSLVRSAERGAKDAEVFIAALLDVSFTGKFTLAEDDLIRAQRGSVTVIRTAEGGVTLLRESRI